MSPRLACADDPQAMETDQPRALALCGRCPALAKCRAWVLSLDPKDEPLGVCGGLTERQRRAHRRANDPRLTRPKKCTTCKEVKTLADFQPDTAMRGGRRNTCKTCWLARRRADEARRRAEQRAKKAAAQAAARIAAGLPPQPQDDEPKQCYRCRQTKQLEEFPRDRSKRSGWSNRCKSCHQQACRDSWLKRRSPRTPDQTRQERRTA